MQHGVTKTGTIIAFIIFIIIVVAIILYNSNEEQEIDVQQNGETMEETEQNNEPTNQTAEENGLVIETLTEGTGKTVVSGDTVTVHYTGTLEDGTVFDSSHNRNTPFTFTVGAGQVIPGWDQGLAGARVGSIRKLTIPSDLAYGDRGVPGVIPGGATLIFEVEVISVQE